MTRRKSQQLDAMPTATSRQLDTGCFAGDFALLAFLKDDPDLRNLEYRNTGSDEVRANQKVRDSIRPVEKNN